MSSHAEQIDPEQLPLQIRNEFGEILLANQPYPDVYYIVVQEDEKNCEAAEYYIVHKSTSSISETVKEYGQVLTGQLDWLVYPMSEDKSGWRLVDYEGLKYLAQHHLPIPERESLHETAVYSAEYHPEYFGEYPAPIITPAGYMLRHKRLDYGIYWLETDHCKQMLSVCHPVWSSELSKAALSLGQQTEYDQLHGVSSTLGCLFFSERDSCVPLFELLRVRENMQCINKAALMNAIWQNFPEYAAAHNIVEQSGANDLLGQLLNNFGEKIELNTSLDRVITILPDVGTTFFCW